MRKLKLLLSGFALLGGVVSVQSQEWTGDITNADGLAFTKQYVGMSDGDVAETWKTSIAAEDGFDLNQSLTNVPDGIYQLSAQAMYRASLTYGTATNCVLYATVGETTFSTPIANFGDYTSKEDRTATGGIATQMQNNNAYLNVVPAVIVEGGNVTIGMKSVGELAYCTNGYWFVFKKSTFTFKNVTESYHAKLVARATTMLATAPASAAKTTLNDALTTYATANFANVKALQAAINTFLETATVENPLNVTDYITNPSFADDSGNKKNWIQDLGYKQPSDIYQPTGWNMLYSSAKVNNTQYQTYKTQTDGAKDNNCYYVRHRWGDVYAVVDLHQLVKGLPAGAYKATVAVKGGSSVTDANTLKLVTGANSNTTTVNDFDKSNYKDYSVQVIKADANSDIDISFGWNQTSGSEQLYYVDDFRLYYLGDPVKAKKNELLALQATIDDTYLDVATYNNVVGTERTTLTSAKSITAASETVEAYETAISSVQNAIDAFTAAKTNYDLLVAEIGKAKALGIADATADGYAATSSSTAATAQTNTQALMVDEYNFVSTNYAYSVNLGSWTEVNIISRTGQHWDGTNESSYKEMNEGWGSDSWSMSMNQDLTLPAGNYVLKAAGRQASGNCQLSLVVKKGKEVIGTVADFPKGDTGLGINTSGATDFTTGEGHTYANGGAGRGFQWRYVKFTLDADATVNVAVAAEGHEKFQWVSFCNATVQTDNEANIALITYNVALGSAQTTIANDNYANVTGSEKTALQDAIDADDALDKTDKDAIEAATTALDDARTAFIAAKDSYNAWAVAKDATYADDKPYASAAKYAAIATAQAATPTTAAAAAAAAAAVTSAYRKYIESNALAEGVAGAEQITVEEYRFAGMTADDIHKDDWKIGTKWTLDGQNNGTISLTNSGSFTDGDGNADYNYVHIQKNDNNAGIHQTINLEPGQYIMTVTARCQSGQGAKFEAFAGGVYVNIPQNDNTGGQFDRGWNDVSVVFNVLNKGDINFGVKSDYGKNIWWSATRFRLVRLGNAQVTIDEGVNYTIAAGTADVTLKRTLKADTWNTFVVPFNITNSELKAIYGNDVQVAEYSEVADGANSTIYFNKMATPEISANKPVLLKPKAGGSLYVFVDRAIASGEAKVAGTNFEFVGTYKATTTIEEGDYFIGSNKLWKSEGSTTIAGTRAYIKAVSADARIGEFSIGENETTGICTLVAQPNANTVYDMQGRRVETMKKGIYVVNGKKFVIK